MLVVQKQEQKAMRDVLYLRLCLRAFSQAEVDFSISAFRKIRNRKPPPPKPQPLFRPSLDVTTYGLVEVHLPPQGNISLLTPQMGLMSYACRYQRRKVEREMRGRNLVI